MLQIVTVGLDLAKNVFQVHGADGSGRAMLRKKLRWVLSDECELVSVCPSHGGVKLQGDHATRQEYRGPQ